MRDLRVGDRVAAREGAKSKYGGEIGGKVGVITYSFKADYIDRQHRFKVEFEDDPFDYRTAYPSDLTRIPKHRSEEPVDHAPDA